MSEKSLERIEHEKLLQIIGNHGLAEDEYKMVNKAVESVMLQISRVRWSDLDKYSRLVDSDEYADCGRVTDPDYDSEVVGNREIVAAIVKISQVLRGEPTNAD